MVARNDGLCLGNGGLEGSGGSGNVQLRVSKIVSKIACPLLPLIINCQLKPVPFLNSSYFVILGKRWRGGGHSVAGRVLGDWW